MRRLVGTICSYFDFEGEYCDDWVHRVTSGRHLDIGVNLERGFGLADMSRTGLVPVTGFTFKPETFVLGQDDQNRKLAACGIDASVFGSYVDAAFLIGAGIHVGIRNGISAEGNVNMLQRLIQRRQVRLGETLTGLGYIKAVTEVPRGWTVDTEVWFEDRDGQVVISVPRRSLKPDPDKVGRQGAGQRPAAVIKDLSLLRVAANYELTPAAVKDYSSEGNSIHYEMEAANRAGFRAPIIGGGMGVHYLTAALWSRFSPSSFDLDIYFRRPIFWDQAFTVKYDTMDAGRWSALGLCSEDKVLTEAKIESLV